ncbi:MAG: TetR family transcriptional regulator C-terminal domain-containing protein [Rhodospirillaceae bacterium]|nr:TetR family transcriptional regulator C-terminal domain-containing protein [Rhodospirillaceae bacterium]
MNETSRDKLIDAAALLFLRQSYQGTGVEDILRATGLSKGSFYHFFPSKESLGEAVARRQQDRVLARWTASLQKENARAPERLTLLLDGIAARMEKTDFAAGCPLGTLAQEMAALSDPIRAILADGMTHLEKLLERWLHDGQKQGDIPADLPADTLARGLWAAIQGALIMSKTRRSTAPLDDIRHFCAATLFTCNAARPD